MKKLLIAFMLFFLLCANGIVWAGENFDKGCDYMQVRHEYDKAEKYFTMAIEQGEYIPDALLYRAINYQYLHKYEKAIQDFTHFLNDYPQNVNSSIGRVNRGLCYYQIGENEKAISDFSDIIESQKYDPNNIWKLYFQRAQAFNAKGEKQKALEDCNKAVNLIETGKCYDYVHKNEMIAPLYALRADLSLIAE